MVPPSEARSDGGTADAGCHGVDRQQLPRSGSRKYVASFQPALRYRRTGLVRAPSSSAPRSRDPPPEDVLGMNYLPIRTQLRSHRKARTNRDDPQNPSVDRGHFLIDMTRVESVTRRHRNSETGLSGDAKVLIITKRRLGIDHDDLCRCACSAIVVPRRRLAPWGGGCRGRLLPTTSTCAHSPENPHSSITSSG